MARDDRPSDAILRQAKADRLAIDLIHHCEQAAMRRNLRHFDPAYWNKSAWRRYLYAAAHAPSLPALGKAYCNAEPAVSATRSCRASTIRNVSSGDTPVRSSNA